MNFYCTFFFLPNLFTDESGFLFKFMKLEETKLFVLIIMQLMYFKTDQSWLIKTGTRIIQSGFRKVQIVLACWVREEYSRSVRSWPSDRFVSQVLWLALHHCVYLVLWRLWHHVHSARHRAGVIKSSYESKWLKEKGRLNPSLENLFYSISVSAESTSCLKPYSARLAEPFQRCHAPKKLSAVPG